MKNLLKLSVALLLLAMTSTVYAQTFGFKVGLNLSKMVVFDDDEIYSEDLKMLPGFHLGPIIEVPISDVFSFESGVLLLTKGFVINWEDFGYYGYYETLREKPG